MRHSFVRMTPPMDGVLVDRGAPRFRSDRFEPEEPHGDDKGNSCSWTGHDKEVAITRNRIIGEIRLVPVASRFRGEPPPLRTAGGLEFRLMRDAAQQSRSRARAATISLAWAAERRAGSAWGGF